MNFQGVVPRQPLSNQGRCRPRPMLSQTLSCLMIIFFSTGWPGQLVPAVFFQANMCEQLQLIGLCSWPLASLVQLWEIFLSPRVTMWNGNIFRNLMSHWQLSTLGSLDPSAAVCWHRNNAFQCSTILHCRYLRKNRQMTKQRVMKQFIQKFNT